MSVRYFSISKIQPNFMCNEYTMQDHYNTDIVDSYRLLRSDFDTKKEKEPTPIECVIFLLQYNPSDELYKIVEKCLKNYDFQGSKDKDKFLSILDGSCHSVIKCIVHMKMAHSHFLEKRLSNLIAAQLINF
jgi:hypothetical protein